MAKIFLSYEFITDSRINSWVNEIKKALLDKGHTVVFGENAIGSDSLRNEILKIIEESDCVVALWENYSEWVFLEVAFALFLRKSILPLCFDNDAPPNPFQDLQWLLVPREPNEKDLAWITNKILLFVKEFIDNRPQLLRVGLPLVKELSSPSLRNFEGLISIEPSEEKSPISENEGYIFISYSHEDKNYALKLQGALEVTGFEVWVDDRIEYGSQWPQVIQEHVDGCGLFIVVMSPRSYKSKWVQNELSRAQRLDKPVFPLLLEGDEPWLSVEAIQYVDVRGSILPPADFYKRLREALS